MPENRKLKELCQDATPEILKLTEILVNMDSGTDDLEGLKRESEFLRKKFEEIGAEARFEPSRPEGARNNVIAQFHGKGAARILLLTHYDTVFSAGEAGRRPFRLEGDRAYGPGVADMQASIAMLLTGLPIFKKMFGAPYRLLTVFCNAEEETGSLGSREIIRELAKEHDIVLNMELSGANGELITVSGRGMANGLLTVHGKAAHSASEPPAGVNAGLELAHQLLQLADLSDPKKRTSVNATMGSFGTKSNVIPELAEALFNIRVAHEEEFQRVESDIRDKIKSRLLPDSQISFSMDIIFHPYGNTPLIIGLADKVRAIAREELDLELGYRHAIGSNDSCFSSEVSPSLDGFGPGCVGMHSVDEFLPVNTLAPRLYILLRTLEEICAGRFIALKEERRGRKREDSARYAGYI